MFYLALLRGINVGGNNIVKMAELRTCLECAGLQKVSTYIQSGNVLFESRSASCSKLAQKVEQALAQELLPNANVVIVSSDQMAEVVNSAPTGFGAQPENYRYDVVFIRPPASANELAGGIPLHPEVDKAWAQNGVIYLRQLKARRTQSRLPKLVRTSAFKSMTVRNWATTTKLHELMRR
ncbi:MAG TPA: DUF1697 domain-containing protein [Bryobacteraceae bacterium]|jgi:uncharacterized protein (DUF1697 family)|nr:DUF1697 domain-containing protein [Bryobacteraceae bacterium]